MDRFFSLRLPFLRFVWHVALVSLAALLPLLALYIVLQPGFAGMLAEGGPALSRFLRQVATNGLPVVFAVNYMGFLLYARFGGLRPCAVIVADISVRLTMFPGLHALIYVLSADWFGSFGGSRVTALMVVAPTLTRAALFGNISGVYLYAALLGALPIYATGFGGGRNLPTRVGPWLAGLACCAAVAAALTVTARATMALQAG